jgi:probable F420-dependent oxidoreductase
MTIIRTEAATALGYSRPEDIDPDIALVEMGLDSLSALELRNKVASLIGRTFSPTVLFEYPTLTKLVNYLAEDQIVPPEPRLGSIGPSSTHFQISDFNHIDCEVEPSSSLKIDAAISPELTKIAETASTLEQQGFDACWSAELAHDPFLPLLLAAEHTSRINIGTSVAVAFARNPMTVANMAWDLQGYSQGRFILGLGTQVQVHIEKRFDMPWSHPARRMREFVQALRAIWSSWQDGTDLHFQGAFYAHTFMTPMFRPGPLACSFPKVFVAAIGQGMTEVCGEVADGMLAHAFTTKRYMEAVTKPALLRGLERSGRNRRDFQVSCPVVVVTGEKDSEIAAAMAATRKHIAVYGSTPAYRAVLDLHGWGDLHTELHRLSLRGDWETMGSLIEEEVIDAFAIVAPIDRLAAQLRDRCANVIDRVTPILMGDISTATFADVADALRGSPT